MEEMTAKQALERTVELWDWVAREGKTKWDWPGWSNYPDTTACGCFLCNYAELHDKDGECSTCPLFGKWDGKESCTDSGTPYSIWHKYKNKKHPNARKAAARIAELCRQELSRMEQEVV